MNTRDLDLIYSFPSDAFSESVCERWVDELQELRAEFEEICAPVRNEYLDQLIRLLMADPTDLSALRDLEPGDLIADDKPPWGKAPPGCPISPAKGMTRVDRGDQRTVKAGVRL